MIDNARTGQNIAAHRQRLNWTQGELARRLNVTHQAVSKWENGVAFPDISTLFELAKLFGTTMEALLTGEGTPSASQFENGLLPSDMPTPECSADAVDDKPSSEDDAPRPTDSYDWDEILSLAPFASRDTLDALVASCEVSCDRSHLTALAPFLSHATLDRLIRNNLDHADWDEILSLAPFASRDTLDALVASCEVSCDRDHLTALAPFLDRHTLDRLILGGTRKKTDESAECPSVRWAEEHEKQMEAAADRLAEIHEREIERAARRAERHAERIAARMEKQFARQAGKVSGNPGKETTEELIQCTQRLTDERRTQIIPAAPSSDSLDAYADRIVSLLYESCDADVSTSERFEDLRNALLFQDYSSLNEFASLLDEQIGPQWLEEYAELCGQAAPDEGFSQQLDLALAQRDWSWIEEHAHLISDLEMIRRIVLVSTTEGFFDFVPLFIDQLDQHSIDSAARQAVRMNLVDDICSFSDRVSPGIL